MSEFVSLQEYLEKDPEPITRFRDGNHFLSNMFPVPGGIVLGQSLGLPADTAPTSEHIYMALRFNDKDKQEEILAAKDGKVARKIAHRHTKDSPDELVDGFLANNIVKVRLMETALELKFDYGTEMARLLLSTGEAELIEGNNWDDNFWGRSPADNEEGLNWLGYLLEDRRSFLRQNTK